jgi:hypothetical protein
MKQTTNYLFLLLLLLISCGTYKTSKTYKKTLPNIKKVAVLTPYADVEQLYLENDFKHEKPTLDTVGIQKGKIYMQEQVIKRLPSSFEAYPLQITSDFQQASRKDMILLLEEIKEHKLDFVSMPAYINEFLKKNNVEYAILLHHIGTYKTIRRSQQDVAAYNTKEALDAVFSATSNTSSSLPSFPDDIISIVHFILYDVKNQKFLYYSKEKNQEIDEPNTPIPSRAVDNQVDELLKKLQKDTQITN